MLMTWSGLYSSTLALHWCVLRSFFFMTHSYLKQYCNFLFSLLFFACLLSRTRSPMLDQCSTWELSQVLFTQTYYSTHHSTFQINAHNCLTAEVWCPAFVARNCQKYAAFLKLGETGTIIRWLRKRSKLFLIFLLITRFDVQFISYI